MRPRRILGYARVSSAEQAVGTSLSDQQAVIRAHAAKGGVVVHRMYVEAESAVHEKLERREQIRALLDDVREGDLVLVDKIDRWSRDPEFTYRSIREILERGASFYAVGDSCDPSTPEGDTMLNFRVLFAREEHKRIKTRMVGTRKLLRDRGYYADGLPPWGYRRQDVRGADRNVLLVDPEQADRVRDVFRLCIAGYSLANIASRVGENRDRVAHTLHNRIYLGEVRDARGQWIRGRHEAIVDAHTFEAVRESMRSRMLGDRKPRSQSRTATWWLRDIAYCIHCGGKMSAVYGRSGTDWARDYLRCYHRCADAKRMVRVRELEQECDPMIAARLVELRDLLAAPPAARPRVAVNVAPALERLSRKRARLLETYADGVSTREELHAALAKVDAERDRLEALRCGPAPVKPEERRAALRAIDEVRRAWAKITAMQRRPAVNAIARRVLIGHGETPRFEWFSPDELARRLP